MKKFFITLVLLAGMIILWSEVISVPEDYGTIQAAIDASGNGDEIIVSPGTYYENINFNGKAVTVASLFYTTQDTSYISQTVIDGSQTGKVVSFNNGESECSILCGFTITNGYSEVNGGGIYTGDSCSPTLTHLRLINNIAEYTGGGFYIGESCSPVMNNLLISGNNAYNGGGGAYGYYCDLLLEDAEITGNVSTHYGGGIYSSEATIEFRNLVVEANIAAYGGGFCFDGWGGNNTLKNVFIYRNEAHIGGGIRTSESLYLESVTIAENTALYGGGGISCDWTTITFAEDIPKRCSIYLNDGGGNSGNDIASYNAVQEIYLAAFSVLVPSVYYVSRLDDLSIDIQFGVISQIDADLYVSPEGDDANSGLSAAEPMQTVRQAVSKILLDAENTIYLSNGVYSSSTNGEIFPLQLPSGVNLQGESRDNVILDGEDFSSLMEFNYSQNITVSGLTITAGHASHGGGIVLSYSDIALEDLKIVSNYASCGGGIYSYGSSLLLNNLIIADNDTYWGGGIYLEENTGSLLKNLTLYGNTSQHEGGGLYSIESHPQIVNCIFWNDSPREIYCTGDNETLMIAYSDIKADLAVIYISSGNLYLLDGYIDENPLFADGSNGDFQLLPDSPCIDAGTAYFEYEGEVLVDLQEDEYWGAAPDMGACEYLANDIDNHVIETGKLKMQNYPNPFNPETKISFNLPEEGEVKLGIYNLKGQLVEKLLAEKMTAGEHSLIWSGQRAGSGIYLLRLQAGNLQQMRKIVMVK